VSTGYFDLLNTLYPSEWYKLPLAAMREVGPAVVTLAAIVGDTDRKKECMRTFKAVGLIAEAGRVPVPTCRKHLPQLTSGGWLLNKGREHTRTGAPRRTVTYVVTPKTRAELVSGDPPKWAPLPKWAMSARLKGQALPWSARAVLAVVFMRLMGLHTRALNQGEGFENLWEFLEGIGGERHFRFSHRYVMELTGLSQQAVQQGKWSLGDWGIVSVGRRQRDDGGDDATVLYPRKEFRVMFTPARDPAAATRSGGY
jgi:hypothetical protein